MTLSLVEAQQRFAEWRAQKQSRREPIPTELWNLAGEVTKRHSQHEVAKALGLSSSALCKKRQETLNASNPSPQKQPSPKFVEINASPSQSTMSCTRIEIERSDGHRMRLFSSVECPFEIKEIIQNFIGENRDPSQRSEQNLFSH